MERFKSINFYYTLTLTFMVSIGAKYLAQVPALKLFGHLVIALVIGMILQVSSGLKEQTKGDIPFISNKFLRLGIILLGFKLALDRLLTEGKKTLLLAFCIVLFMIVLTYFMCRIFKVEKELALLSSCGCGICGAAAVMGVSGQIKAKTDNSVLAVAVVAILGTVFTLIEVALKPYLHLEAYNYGIFTGGSLHEIAHAVAAGGAGGQLALDTAILTKLSRVLMLIVVAGVLVVINRRNSDETSGKMPMPYFILGFIFMSILGSYMSFLKPLASYFVDAAYIFLGMAMAALGMSVNFKVIKQRGLRVFIACFLSSAILMFVCYIVAKFLF
ncbi:YeiH family protein [Gemella cuniculi]|uniref:YeiH family protein n=1 Tax=Gemella cuniculi TaxID=150240 RepID=UPI000421AFC9|nr:putative sulfate exporter family transporter [Gemella cuniculi]